MRRWMVLLALVLPAIPLAWMRYAVGQVSYSAVIYHANGSQSSPAIGADSNQDAWPDDPFAALGEGDLWLASAGGRTVAALRWTDSGAGTREIDVDLARPDGSLQRMWIQSPAALVQPGEIAILLLSVAPDLESLLGAGTASLPQGHVLMPGAQCVEISVLISPDGGVTFDEIDPVRLAAAPIRVRIENLTADVDTIPVLYEHPTYIESDPQIGLMPLAEPGDWTPVSCMTLPHEERAPGDETYPAYLEAELQSLSIFAPLVLVQDETGEESENTEGTSGEPQTPNEGEPVDTGGPSVDGGGPDDSLNDEEPSNSFNGEGEGEGEGLALLSSPEVYVDFEYVGVESGTESHPFNSIMEAIVTVQTGGTIFIAPGVTHEIPAEISKPVTLQLWTLTRQLNTVTVGDITACGPNIDNLSYTDFAQAAALSLSGDAVISSNEEDIDLVHIGGTLAGAIWTGRKVRVDRGFSTTFEFQLLRAGVGPPPLQSDGISFVIQTSGQSPGLSTGGQMGYTGIGNSVAIEFDAFQNIELNDPSFPHIGVHTGGIGNANHAHENSSLLTEQSIGLTGTARTAHITYDPRARTLQVRIGVNLLLSLADFRLEDHMTLDDGHAYIGLMATTGDPAVTNGHTTVLCWNASFPQSCEEVLHLYPVGNPEGDWDAVGYPGDTFDHRITGTILTEGDFIQERLEYVTDDMNMAQEDKDQIALAANGRWYIGPRIDKPGLWRRKDEVSDPADHAFDEHAQSASNTPSIAQFFQAGGIVGNLVFIQEMVDESTGFVVARHKISYRFVKSADQFTVNNSDCYTFGYPNGVNTFLAHCMVRKQDAFNPAVWPAAHTDPPVIPCPL